MQDRLALLLVAFAASASIALAQPPARIPGGAPPRDRGSAADTGTAMIRGRVFAGDTGKPLRRARITITAPELGTDARSASTSIDGRFEIRDLPAGRFTLRVARSGYLALQYGQRRPLEPGKPLVVEDRQVVSDVDFTLPRAGVIAGRLGDELNEPVADVQVFAMRQMYYQGKRRLVPAGGPPARTDDAGEFRVTGLTPGSYILMATLRETWPVVEDGVERILGYAPTYYPGTAALGEARPVVVAAGRDAINTNFSLMPGRAASVSGTAFDSLGAPLANRSVSVTQDMFGPNGALIMLVANATTAVDGTFMLKNVPPGQYRLRAQAGSPTRLAQGAGPEAAALPLTLDGVDVTGVTLTTSAGWTITGRITTETGAAPQAPPIRFRLAARLVDGDTNAGPPQPPAGAPPPPGGGPALIFENGRVNDDWTFTIRNISGAARIRVTTPDGWMVKLIGHDGRDITDAPIELGSGQALDNVEVVVTSTVTTVSGQLADEKGAPLVEGTIIVFADDASRWAEESRWVRAVRPDQQGRYQIKGLPPGEYLAIALNYVEDGVWNDPEYLESIRRYAQKMTLNDGDTRSAALKLVTP